MVDYREGSAYLEYVINALATRSATCLDGISPEWAEKFDSADSRSNYLRMQAVLSDLILRERALLGQQFESVIGALADHTDGYIHSAVRLDWKPEWVFLFAASKGVERGGISSDRGVDACCIGFYRKQRCLVMVDRDGEGYEVAMTHPDLVFVPSATEVQHGEQMFGRLRNASVLADGY